MEVIDLLIQERNYLTLEPLYSSLAAVRCYVDSVDKLKYLGYTSFYSGYFSWIRNYFIENSVEQIVKLLPFIQNPEGIYIYTSELLSLLEYNLYGYNSKYYYVDPSLFIALSKNLSYTGFPKLFQRLGESVTSHNTRSKSSMDWVRNITVAFLENNNLIAIKLFYDESLDSFIMGVLHSLEDDSNKELITKCIGLLSYKKLLYLSSTMGTQRSVLENIEEFIVPLLSNIKDYTFIESLENGGSIYSDDVETTLNAYIYSIACSIEYRTLPLIGHIEPKEGRHSLIIKIIRTTLLFNSYKTLETFICSEEVLEECPIDDLFRGKDVANLFYVPQLKGKGNAQIILRYIKDTVLVAHLKEKLSTCILPTLEEEMEIKSACRNLLI